MKTVYVKRDRILSKWRIRRIAKKLEKQSKKEDIVVLLNKRQLEREELVLEIKSRGIKVLDGKWLFKFLLLDSLEVLAKLKGIPLETANVAICVSNSDSIINSEIILIASVVKNLKIVTNFLNRFSYIEERLYSEFGIAAQVTSNKEKAFSNTDIIINIDEFNIEEYNLPKNAYILDIYGASSSVYEAFSGKIFNSYELEYDEELFKEIENKEEYDENLLYESLIYRKDTYQHIRAQMDADGVKVVRLYYNKEKVF